MRILAALLAAALTVLAAPAPAEADLLPWRWRGSSVCVEDHTDSRWPVKSAVAVLTAAPDLNLYWRTSCAGWSQVIGVVQRDLAYPRAGEAYVRYSGSYLTRVEVRVARWARVKNWYDRRIVVLHELQHGVGIDDNPWYRTTMGRAPYVWNTLTDYDWREIERRYPW